MKGAARTGQARAYTLGAGELTLSLGEARLQSCLCHHGCGPGIDGMFALVATSIGSRTRTARITRVELTAIGMPGGPFAAPDSGSFRIAGSPDASFIVPAGTTSSVAVELYLDLDVAPPMPLPGEYDVVVSVAIDGSTTTTRGLLPIELGPSCR